MEITPYYPQTLDQVFNGMDDSVTFINEAVAAQSTEWVSQNRDHLLLKLSKDYIINAGRDLSIYESAIASANTLLGE